MTNKILVTGFSKIPGGIAGSDVYSVIGLGLEIEVNTGIIMDVDSNLVLDLAKKHFKSILIGENIKKFNIIEYKLKYEYHGSARKALIVALKICYDRYLKALENRKRIEKKYDDNGFLNS